MARIVHWHLFCWFVLFLKRDKMSSKYCTILYNNILKNSHDICGLFSFVFICIFHLIKFVFYSIHNMSSWPSSDAMIAYLLPAHSYPYFGLLFCLCCFRQIEKEPKKIPWKKSMIESTKFFVCLCASRKKRNKWIWVLKRFSVNVLQMHTEITSQRVSNERC